MVGVLFLALRGVDWAEVPLLLAQVTLGELALFLGVNGLLALLLANRWWLSLRLLGAPVSFGRVAIYRLVGATVSLLTPGPQFGGEPMQVWLLNRRSRVPLPTAIASVTLEKSMELLANFTFLLAALIYVAASGLLGVERSPVVLGISVGLLALPLLFLFALYRGRRPVGGLARHLARWLPRSLARRLLRTNRRVIGPSEARLAALMQEYPLRVAGLFGVSLGNWLFLMAEYWLALTILGLEISPAQALAAMTALRLAVLLPSPAGLGVLEASQILALTALGAGPAAGVGLSLLIRLRDLLLIGLGLLLAQISYRWSEPAIRQPGDYSARA
jgi:uncharacterized protein (TIRG00374 family)